MKTILTYGEFIIPDDAVVTVDRDRHVINIHQRMHQNKIAPDDYRCRNCKYYDYGYTTRLSSFKVGVCTLKPKNKINVYYGEKLYKRAEPKCKPCEHFIKKNNDDNK